MANKRGVFYVNNDELLSEIIKSKESGMLTDRAICLISLIARRFQRKHIYKNEEDKQDAFQTIMLSVIKYWDKFDEQKYNNAFAYFTQMAKRGCQLWKRAVDKEKDAMTYSISGFSLEKLGEID